MKKTFLPSLIGLLACALSSSAITITIDQDDAAQLVFTVVWGAAPPVLNEFVPGAGTQANVTGGGGSQVLGIDNGLNLTFDVGRFGSPNLSGIEFSFLFASLSDRSFASGMIVPGNLPPNFVHALPGELYGAQFVYVQNVPVGVPDGGSTLLLVAGALGTLGWCKRRFPPARAHTA